MKWWLYERDASPKTRYQQWNDSFERYLAHQGRSTESPTNQPTNQRQPNIVSRFVILAFCWNKVGMGTEFADIAWGWGWSEWERVRIGIKHETRAKTTWNISRVTGHLSEGSLSEMELCRFRNLTLTLILTLCLHLSGKWPFGQVNCPPSQALSSRTLITQAQLVFRHIDEYWY